MNKYVGISVIICCYNSAKRLPATLKYLADQALPDGFPWEIIVVNNSSTDDTVQTALTLWNEYKPEKQILKIVTEDKAGQMFARIRGVKEAQFPFLIFCDDDNLLDKNYVLVSHEVLLNNENIGAAGGGNSPVTDAAEYPEWFEQYKDKYAIGTPSKQTGDVSSNGFLLGAGLVTHKNIFLEVFDEKYPSLLNGRNGEKLSTGDDFEYCKRLLLWKYKLYYDERLHLNHFIPKERLTIDYRERLMKGIDDAGKILKEYDLVLKATQRISNKNQLRLLILTPFRILLAELRLSKRNIKDEKIVFNYLMPFHLNPNPTRTAIKRFLNKQ